MASAVIEKDKRPRGRPRTDAVPVLVRMQAEVLSALDKWIKRQDPKPSRPAAIRQILMERLNEVGCMPTRRDLRPSKRKPE